MRRSARLSRNTPDSELESSSVQHPAPSPAPAPKKPKRLPLKDRPRPEYPYELIHRMPVTQHIPDAAELTNPLDFAASKSLGYSVHASRNAYLNGAMFDTVWSRKPKAKGEVESNPLNRTLKLCDCVFIMGPHRFLGKLFTVKEEDSTITRPRQVEGPPPSSQKLVLRLREMAQTDPVLKSLMAEVASGKASPQLVAEFQKYMQKAREMDTPAEQKPQEPAAKEGEKPADSREAPKEPAKDVPKPTPPAPPATPPAPPEKPMSLAFEFNDNPSERFVFPRESIYELLANTDVLLSFVCVNDGEYTPLTITIRELPPRFFPTFEKCFQAEALARKHMTETMQKNKRAKNHYVWYQIDKTDALVLDEIRKMQPPYFAIQQPKRQYKTRKYTQKYSTIPSNPTPGSVAAPSASSSIPKTGGTLSTSASTSAVPAEPSPQVPRPKLNLPDINSIRIPTGGLPPLPKSLQGLVPQREQK